MCFTIDAWLDCPNPSLRVFEKHSGAEVLNFNSVEIKELIATGDLCPAELNTTNTKELEEVVKELILYSCAHKSSTPF